MRRGALMNALVVYESFWGNTALIAGAIAEGIGPEAKLLVTDEATDALLAVANLIVVGAPIHGFSLPRAGAKQQLANDPKAPSPPDLSHRLMREWLEAVPKGDAHFAAFETGFKWSPGGAAGKIGRELRAAGYQELARHERFLVAGSYGPPAQGEVERARGWGSALALAMQSL